MRIIITYISIFIFTLTSYAQNAVPAGIIKDNNHPAQIRYNFDNSSYPTQISKYNFEWHGIPMSQGISGTCWAYSAVSFLESEEYRISKRKIKLSEMFVVYYEYVDRAKHFVETRGETFIGQGSENNAILRIMKSYGIVPYSQYNGLPDNQKYNNHKQLFSEYSEYLQSVKKTGQWDLDIVLSNVKTILNQHLGKPPESFKIDGNIYNPKTYLNDYLKIKPENYFSFMSTLRFNYNEKNELVEDDNRWNGDDYYNISLEDFINLFHKSISSGYTISLCGDVTESGYDKYSEVAIIPDYDIPSEYIDEFSRQFRLENSTTFDDHCIHVVGFKEFNGGFWYLIKDSNSGAFDGENKGYRFYHQDYILLKMIHYMVHVDPAREILDNIIK